MGSPRNSKSKSSRVIKEIVCKLHPFSSECPDPDPVLSLSTLALGTTSRAADTDRFAGAAGARAITSLTLVEPGTEVRRDLLALMLPCGAQLLNAKVATMTRSAPTPNKCENGRPNSWMEMP